MTPSGFVDKLIPSRMVVVSGEPPWVPGTVLEVRWTVPMTVVMGEPPWEVGRRLTATLNEPER